MEDCYDYDEFKGVEENFGNEIPGLYDKHSKSLDCAAKKVQESKNIGELTLNIQQVSIGFNNLFLDCIASLKQKLTNWESIGYDKLCAFAFKELKKYAEPYINKLIIYAKQVGKVLKADSIGITFGFPFTLSITVNFDYKIPAYPPKTP